MKHKQNNAKDVLKDKKDNNTTPRLHIHTN